MKMLPILALAAAGIVVAGCGTVRENRFNETSYADHLHYDHDVVSRSPGYGERYYDEDDDVVYVRPAYRVVPVARDDLIYGGDGYYYYRD